MTTTEDVIRAAASVGRDVAEGKLAPAALSAAVTDECRDLFGAVVGPADPLWAVHLDVARQVLALDGLSTDELSQWMAVARSRDTDAEPSRAVTPPDGRADVGGQSDAVALGSSASEAHSPGSDGIEPEAGT